MPDQATQRLAEIISRIAKLPSQNLEPPQFFASFLQLTVAATGSRGGAIWLTQSGQPPQCYCHIDLEVCGIKEPNQQRLVVEAVQRTVEEVKPLVIPTEGAQISDAEMVGDADSAAGGQNKCRHPLFFKPLRAGQKVAMVLQLIGAEGLNPHDHRVIVGLLEQVAESAETYLAHRRAAVLEDDRKALARLLQYAEAVHGSLDAEKVVYQVANLGRDAIGCNRVVVWIDPQVKRGLRAVSGVDRPDRRGVLLQSLEKLSKHCLEIKTPIVASRQQLVELPEEQELTRLLRNYFNASQLDQIFLQPMKDKESFLGVVIAEGFDEQTGTNLAGLIATVAKHGAVALSNALEMASVPLVRPLAKLQKVKRDPKKRRKWTVVLVTLAVCLIIALLLPWTIQIDCECELTPLQVRVIDAPLDGVQINKIVRAGGQVQKGEIIAQLNDDELQAERFSLEAALEQERIKKDRLTRPTDIESSNLQLQRLQSQIELIGLQIEKCKVRAPINGTILTPQLELLEGLTMNRGDQICEIADLNRWQLLLDVPQQEIGWVQRGLSQQEDLGVLFFLAAYPEYKLKTMITEAGQISQMAQIKDKGNVFEVRTDVPGTELGAIKQALRSGSTGRAKIATVQRPLGYVILRKVIRFFRVTFF